jgi:hypothetical protein
MVRTKVTSRKIDSQIAKLQDQINRLTIKRSDIMRRIEHLERKFQECPNDNQPRGPKFQVELKSALRNRSLLEDQLENLREQQRHLEASLMTPLIEKLHLVNGKALAHTLSASNVVLLARETEELLMTKGVTQQNRIGAEVALRPAGKKASNAYAAKASSSITTRVKLRRVTDGWRLIEAKRDHCYINQSEARSVYVHPAAHADILKTATQGILMIPQQE